jgi:SSS family solute:Na+ symporter
MHPLDWLMVALYFAALLGLAWWVIRKGRDTADDYFLAGRNLGWFIVGASIFSSNIGSEHLVGLAGSGCTDGVAMAHYELHAWCLLILGWVMVPFYARSMVFTMPEFLERRFNATARWVLSIISLVAWCWGRCWSRSSGWPPSAGGASSARRWIPTCSTSGSRWCPRGWKEPGPRCWR